MDLKNKKSPRKVLNKSHSSNSLPKKRPTLSRDPSKKKHNQSKTNITQVFANKSII